MPSRWSESISRITSRIQSLTKRSPLARAVLPVAGGLAVIALIFGATWGIAAWNARGATQASERLAPTLFKVGGLESIADTIDVDGPLLFPGLNTTSGERSVIVDHGGTDPTRGWHAYWAYPADTDASCIVTQVQRTERFTDCNGREVTVADLALPVGVCPLIDNDVTLYINLRCDIGGSAPASTPPPVSVSVSAS